MFQASIEEPSNCNILSAFSGRFMYFRKTVFWLHLFCGVITGIVVLIMSVTGVALTYQKQLPSLLTPAWEVSRSSDQRLL
jgi:uncharacterized iron-regulated membrane protein